MIPLARGPWRAAAAALLAVAFAGCTAPPQGRPPALTMIDPPAAPASVGPNLAAGAGGVSLTWLEPDGAGHALRLSSVESAAAGRGWTKPSTITAGDGFFANWADFPSIGRAAGGEMVAHWLARSGQGTYAYDVRLARSADGGATWRALGSPHRDGAQVEHGFVSLIADAGGVRAFWLDGREMRGGHGTDAGGAAVGSHGSMALRTALVSDTVGPEEVLDERVCECCQTAAAVTSEGPLVVYRDRSESEVRDIWAVRRTPAGWSDPYPIHRDGWEVPGCPVNGPALAADGPLVAVAWFTAEGNRPRVQVALSNDAGATFAQPVVVDAEQPLGRVGIAVDGSGGAIVSWLASGDGDSARILARRVAPEGRMGERTLVAPTSRARASGFPRMARLEQSMVFAWTEAVEPSRLRAAALPLTAIPAAVSAAERPERAVGTARDWDREVGSGAPDYAASSLDGRRVTLADHRGWAVLVNVWATWCLPCREETPALVDLHRRRAPDGLRVVGVSIDGPGSVDQVRHFVASAGIPYTVWLDPEDRASRVFGLPALPGTFLFDRGGVLVWKRVGLLRADDPDLAEAITRALAGS